MYIHIIYKQKERKNRTHKQVRRSPCNKGKQKTPPPGRHRRRGRQGVLVLTIAYCPYWPLDGTFPHHRMG
jgi:hypothetical protein